MKIYVGCAIQSLPENQWKNMFNEIELIRSKLRLLGHQVLNFRSTGQRTATASEIFEWDHRQCMECDAMIGIAISPSTGMGMEIAFCLTRPNPAKVYVFAPRDSNPSMMLVGCNLPGYVFTTYDDLTDIPSLFNHVSAIQKFAATA